jgi:hypothetical protein
MFYGNVFLRNLNLPCSDTLRVVTLNALCILCFSILSIADDILILLCSALLGVTKA